MTLKTIVRTLHLALLALVLTSGASAQLVTVAETLLDSQGNLLNGTLTIVTPTYLLPTGTVFTITDVTNATPCVVTTSVSHGLANGQSVYITGVVGNTAPNGKTWVIAGVTSTTFSLNGCVGNGAYVSGGTAQRVIPVGPSRRQYTVTSGAVSLQLYPTTTGIGIPGGSSAGFTHLVNYQLNDGSTYLERWNIPPTPTTTTVSAVRAPGVLNPTAQVDPSQLADGTSADGRNAFLCSDGINWQACVLGIEVNAQAGTSYTVLNTDRRKLITISNAAAVAITLPQAGGSGEFTGSWFAWFSNLGAGLATITPTTSTINGAASYRLFTGQSVLVVSDGTNYQVIPGMVGFSSAVKNQTGTTYTVLDGDRGKLLTFSNAGAVAVTLPQAGASSAFVANWGAFFSNRGAGTVTITPTTSTIDGAASLALTTGSGALIISDGTNYFTFKGGAGLADCGANGFVARTALNTTACRTFQGTASVITITNPTGAGGDPVFNVGANVPALTPTDDRTIIANGTAWEAKTVPNCTDTGGQHLNYDQSTNTLSCGTSGSGSGYNTIQDEGIGLTARTTLNFAGGGVSCADDAGTKTTCTISGTATTFTMLVEYVAAICQNTTAHLGLSTFTSNQPTGACVTGTNSTYGVAQFPDADGDYQLQGRFTLPHDLTSTIDLLIKWRTSATTGDVVWQVQTACVADAETGDPSWNTASTVTDTAKGVANQWNDATITTVTITGCAADEVMLFKFFRNRTHASDTLAAVPELMSIRWKVRRSI